MLEKTDKWIAASTTLIAVLTALSLAVSLYAAQVSHKQWEAVDAANRETINSVNETIDAINKQTQAYVILDKVFFTNLDFKAREQGAAASPITSSSQVSYSIVNIGATPAFHVRERAISRFLPQADFLAGKEKLIPDSAKLLQTATDFQGGGTLGKDRTDKTDADWNDAAVLNHVLDFTSGKTVIYVDMNVVYRDLYDAPHFLSECFAFDAATKITKETGEIIQYATCGEEYDEYPKRTVFCSSIPSPMTPRMTQRGNEGIGLAICTSLHSNADTRPIERDIPRKKERRKRSPRSDIVH